MSTKTFQLIDDDSGDEYEIELPVRFDVCPTCEGHGTHLHPEIGSHAYSSEQFAEDFDDEEREQYFRRGGVYDVTCGKCKGVKVVYVIDGERCTTEAQKKALMDIEAQGEADRAFAAEERHLRRMETGYAC